MAGTSELGVDLCRVTTNAFTQNALDHPEALVTDLSTIGDFGLDDDERSAASDRLGVAVSDDDYVYEIARRLRDQP